MTMANTRALELRQERLLLKERRSQEREKILVDRLLTPANVRLLTLMAILAYSTYVTRSKQKQSPIAGTLAFGLTGIGLPLIAADAGITDKYALAAISAAGLGYTGLSMFQGWSEAGVDFGDVLNANWLADLATAPVNVMQQVISAINPFD